MQRAPDIMRFSIADVDFPFGNEMEEIVLFETMFSAISSMMWLQLWVSRRILV
jgi:hypothetical protein